MAGLAVVSRRWTVVGSVVMTAALVWALALYLVSSSTPGKAVVEPTPVITVPISPVGSEPPSLAASGSPAPSSLPPVVTLPTTGEVISPGITPVSQPGAQQAEAHPSVHGEDRPEPRPGNAHIATPPPPAVPAMVGSSMPIPLRTEPGSPGSPSPPPASTPSGPPATSSVPPAPAPSTTPLFVCQHPGQTDGPTRTFTQRPLATASPDSQIICRPVHP
jgi:hypothetical protein